MTDTDSTYEIRILTTTRSTQYGLGAWAELHVLLWMRPHPRKKIKKQ